MRIILLVVHNVRSSHNVGSLLRTAEGLGVGRVYLTGYTPYPPEPADSRLPYLAAGALQQIHKTALGAEDILAIEHHEHIEPLLKKLKLDGFRIVALEQTPASIALPDYSAPYKIVLVVGREVEGIEPEVLGLCNECVAIPMLGQKESFNVVQAAAMALYHARFVK